MVKRLYLIGVGPGDPRYLTLEAYQIIKKLRVFLIPEKKDKKAGLTELRLGIIRFVKGESPFEVIYLNFPEREKGSNYRLKVEEWRKKKAEILFESLKSIDEEEVGFLVIGDPAIYDGHVEILHEVSKYISFEFVVIPGLSAYQVLAAKERLSLTDIATPLHFHTPRTLRNLSAVSVPTVVFLDNYETFRKFRDDHSISIHWGAFIGTEKETIVYGNLARVCDQISELRRRFKKVEGHLLEIYFLRPDKRRPFEGSKD